VFMVNPTEVAATCTCIYAAYTYDVTSQKCLCSIGAGYCSSLISTNPSTTIPGNTSCACIKNYVYSTSWQECVLNCGTISNSTGLPDGRIACSCVTPYVWNPNTNTFVFQCIFIANTSTVLTGL
jgi:hypothetical protein